jgi:hypothetical protein
LGTEFAPRLFSLRRTGVSFMTKLRRTVIISALAVLGTMAVASGPASARSAYDGAWSVVVTGNGGACSGTYRYPVAIINGIVRHARPGNGSFNISGRVGSGGHVSVGVSRGGQHAYGVGRLSRFAGAGSWRSPNGCAGYWQAARHG